MLVLSRNIGERIMIQLPTGEEIAVQVCRVQGTVVRLGFEAPEAVRIVRQELLEKATALLP